MLRFLCIIYVTPWMSYVFMEGVLWSFAGSNYGAFIVNMQSLVG